jgi:hypothetical protein
VILALVVTPEGFPLSYEVFDGNRADVTTLQEMLDLVEARHGHARRIWVFDRGIVSEENLETLRRRGGSYLVGTPRSSLKAYEAKLLDGDWQSVSAEVQVQLIAQEKETYVLARSAPRAHKEKAMRGRVVRGLMRDLIRLRRLLRHGRLKDPTKVFLRLGGLAERYPQAWRYVEIKLEALTLSWQWDRKALALAQSRDGAYLLRTNVVGSDPATLWRQYIQLTEVEAVFRALKSDLAIRPIWHFTPRRWRPTSWWRFWVIACGSVSKPNCERPHRVLPRGNYSTSSRAFNWWKSGLNCALAAASVWNASPSLSLRKLPSSTNSAGHCRSNRRLRFTRAMWKMCGQPEAA